MKKRETKEKIILILIIIAILLYFLTTAITTHEMNDGKEKNETKGEGGNVQIIINPNPEAGPQNNSKEK